MIEGNVMSRNGYAMATKGGYLWLFKKGEKKSDVYISWTGGINDYILVNGEVYTVSPYTSNETVYHLQFFEDKSRLEWYDTLIIKINNFDGISRLSFANLPSLRKLDISEMNTSTFTSFDSMFEDCSSLTDLNIDNLNTSNSINFKLMFSKCKSLDSIGLKNLDLTRCCDATRMVSDCSSLDTLDLSDMSIGTYGLTKASGYTSDGTYERYGFNNFANGCENLQHINLTNTTFNDDNAFYYAFSNCPNLIDVKLNNISNPYNTNSSYLFYNDTNLNTVDMSTWSWGDNARLVFMDCPNLDSVNMIQSDFTKVKTCEGMFIRCSNLKSFNSIGMAQNTILRDCSDMFLDCSELIYCEMTKFTFENLRNGNIEGEPWPYSGMNLMFDGCVKLEWIDFSNLKIPYLTLGGGLNMTFRHCYSLKCVYVDNVSDTDIDKLLTTINDSNNELEHTYKLGTYNERKAIVIDI